MKRLGLSHLVTQYLDPELMLPAVGQGALGIETRTEDLPTNEVVEGLAHPPTMVAVKAERAFLRRLQGGCEVPLGGYATLEGDRLSLAGLVADLQGRQVVRRVLQGESRQAEEIGDRLAEMVLSAGGAEILAVIYGSALPTVSL
jgi:hydroxymethylbilane synthase